MIYMLIKKRGVHEINKLIAYFGARSKLKSHFYPEMIILILMDDTVSLQPAAQDKFSSWQYNSEKTQYLTSKSPKKSI